MSDADSRAQANRQSLLDVKRGIGGGVRQLISNRIKELDDVHRSKAPEVSSDGREGDTD